MRFGKKVVDKAAKAYAGARVAHQAQRQLKGRVFADKTSGPKRILPWPELYAEVDKKATAEFKVLVEPLITAGGRPVLSQASPLQFEQLVADQVMAEQEVFAKGEYPLDEDAFVNGGHDESGRGRYVGRFDRLDSSFNRECVHYQASELYKQVEKPLYTRHDAGWRSSMQDADALMSHQFSGGCPVFSSSPLQHLMNLLHVSAAKRSGVMQLRVFDSGLMAACHVLNANEVLRQLKKHMPYVDEYEHTLSKALLPDTRLCTVNIEMALQAFSEYQFDSDAPWFNVIGNVQINPLYIDYVDLEVCTELKAEYRSLYHEAVAEIGPRLLEAENPDVDMSEYAMQCLVKKIEAFNERMSQFHAKRLLYKAAAIYGDDSPAYKQLCKFCEAELHTVRLAMIHHTDDFSSVLPEPRTNKTV